MKTQEPFPVHGIHLARIGDDVIVSVDVGEGVWVELIRERHESNFSHIIEPNGIRTCADVPFSMPMVTESKGSKCPVCGGKMYQSPIYGHACMRVPSHSSTACTPT